MLAGRGMLLFQSLSEYMSPYAGVCRIENRCYKAMPELVAWSFSR